VVRNLAENGGRVTALPVRLFHFRIRKSSISHTSTFPNIDDCWKANRIKYEGLRDYEEHFIQSCFVVICMMWANYSGFSKDDKARAEATVLEMESFSRKHFREIIRGEILSSSVRCFWLPGISLLISVSFHCCQKEI
jgi:hypothetical protein